MVRMGVAAQGALEEGDGGGRAPDPHFLPHSAASGASFGVWELPGAVPLGARRAKAQCQPQDPGALL